MLPVYVAEMEDQCNLDLDYLAPTVCLLDLCSMELSVQRRPISVKVVKETTPGNAVRALRMTVIPPRS